MVNNQVEIPRDHLVRTLEAHLDGETQTVVVEGAEGLGKTTLLRQFLKATSQRAFGVFIRASSTWAYDPFHVGLELASQMSQRLRSTELTEEEIADYRKVYGRFLTQLDRTARREKKPFYIILDGLDDIPESDTGTRGQLLNLLPFGYEGLRFLVSGDFKNLPLTQEARRTTKSWRVPYFTKDEADKYLVGYQLSHDQLQAIYDTTGGIPGYLASVWRRLGSGASPQELIKTLPDAVRDSFALEWRGVQQLSEPARMVLGVLAYESRAFTVDALSQIVRGAPEQIAAELRSLRFVQTNQDMTLQFVSEAFRKFAASQLEAYRQRVGEAVIDVLLIDPDSDAALAQLPTLYSRAGRFTDVLEYLSPERFARLYQRTPSLNVIKEKADEGIAAARVLKRDGDLVRFTIQKSAVDEIAHSDVGVAEVKARSALGDFDNALGLANGVRRTELRLRLLAAIARIRRERGLPDDEELGAQLRALYGQIDPSSLGEALATTASDLFATAPDLAIDLVSKGGGGTGDNSIDWALASLAVQAVMSDDDSQSRQKAREIRERIQDPAARKLSLELGVILGGRSAREVIEEADRVETAGDRLYIVQKWMWSNRDRSDASEVLDYGIRVALQATGYTANAQVFRELAACLPYLSDLQAVSYYTSLIDGQRAELERIGPADDFIRLQLIMARAEWKHDHVAGRTRFAEVYYAIGRIKELATRTGCVARLAAALTRTDKERELERDDSLHSLVDQELNEGVDAILAGSAEQFEACRPVIQALAIACPAIALDIVSRLNTETRRDLGYAEFVEAAAGGPLAELNPEVVMTAITTITDPEVRDSAIEKVVRALRRRKLTANDAGRLEELFDTPTTMYRWEGRALRCAELVSVLLGMPAAARAAVPGLDDLISRLTEAAEESWKSIDDDWAKLDLGFEIIAALASGAPELATKFVEEANRVKRHLVVGDSETALAADLAMRLAIRAYAGLAAKNLGDESQRERLLVAIGRVGSLYGQAVLLAELAVRSHLAGKSDDSQALVQDKLVPLVYAVPVDHKEQRAKVVIATAPALFVGAPATALTIINNLPRATRGEALGSIATFLLRKTSPLDPYDHMPHSGYDIKFEDANQIVQVMREMEEDWRIYSLVESLAVSASSALYGANFKHGQRAELVRQLEAIALEKFPSPRFIRHQGYRIIAQAQINRLRAPGAAIPISTLAAQAREVPNAADRAFVLAILASTARTAKDRHQLFAEAREATEQLPTLAERLDHYHSLGTRLLDSDEQQSQEIIGHAIQLSLTGEGDSIDDLRQSLVELACRHHPELAASIASMTDDDPAKQRIENELRLHKIKNAIAIRKASADAPSVAHIFEWSRASWMKLGSLVAGRAAPANPTRAIPILEYAGKQPISRSYPILAWFIENAVRFQRGTVATRDYVGPLFNACLLGAEVAFRSAERSGAIPRQLEVSEFSDSSSTLIQDGERAQGLQFIKDWLSDLAPQNLWIVEPYFGPECMEALALVSDCCEDCEVVILCGRQESIGNRTDSPEKVYGEAWRRIRSDDPPPTTVILAQGKFSRKFPIHDRWWFATQGGLGLGTSYNGIGARVSEIRRLSAEDVAVRLVEFNPYFTLSKKVFHGERIEYSSCSL